MRSTVMAFNDLLTNYINDSKAPPINGYLVGWTSTKSEQLPFCMISVITLSLSLNASPKR